MLGPVAIQGRITSIRITSRVKFYYYPCFTDEASDLNVQVKSSNIVKQEVTAMGFEPRPTWSQYRPKEYCHPLASIEILCLD